jgi:hypothetical protein
MTLIKLHLAKTVPLLQLEEAKAQNVEDLAVWAMDPQPSSSTSIRPETVTIEKAITRGRGKM